MWVDGQKVRADNLAPPSGKLSLSEPFSVANITDTQIPLDTVEHDYRAVTDAVNNRIVSPSDGLFRLAATLRWAVNTTDGRVVWINVNGVTVAQQSSMGSWNARGGTTNAVSVEEVLSAGDVITLWCFQASGGSLDVLTSLGGTQLSMTFVRD